MKTQFHKHLDFPDTGLHLFLDKKEFDRFAERMAFPPEADRPWADATTVTYAKKEQTHICVLYFLTGREKMPSTVALAGLLAHEAVHVWQSCCVTMREDRAGDEVSAYAIQFIFQWMFDHVMTWVVENDTAE